MHTPFLCRDAAVHLCITNTIDSFIIFSIEAIAFKWLAVMLIYNQSYLMFKFFILNRNSYGPVSKSLVTNLQPNAFQQEWQSVLPALPSAKVLLAAQDHLSWISINDSISCEQVSTHTMTTSWFVVSWIPPAENNKSTCDWLAPSFCFCKGWKIASTHQGWKIATCMKDGKEGIKKHMDW